MKACVSGFGLDTDFASMLLDNPVNGVQPESRALALRFGGEEWLEDAPLNFGRNARAVVTDFDQDVIGLGRCADPQVARPFIASMALTIRLVQI